MSPTAVGATHVLDVARRCVRPRGSTFDQVHQAVELLQEWCVLPTDGGLDNSSISGTRHSASRTPNTVAGRCDPSATHSTDAASGANLGAGRSIVVLTEPGRHDLVSALLGEAYRLAARVHADVVVAGPDPGDPGVLWQLGADRVIHVIGSSVEEDVAGVLATWCRRSMPWAVLAPGTLWGREVAARLAASLGAGMAGDAVSLDVDDSDRLVCWKPAFSGRIVAEVTTSSAVQVATVRPGSRPARPWRVGDGAAIVETVATAGRARVRVLAHHRDPAVGALLGARRVVGVGMGVAPDGYDTLRPLLRALDAQLAATRRVTDRGWLPRARQVGITGHHLTPDLYVAIGVGGAFNHMAGVRGAGTIVAINRDPGAPVFDWADIALVGDWHDIVPVLAAGVRAAGEPTAIADLEKEGLLLFPGVDSPPCSHFSRSDLTTIRTLLDLGSDALASLR